MPTCGYEFYLRVFISISIWTREDKIHIHARACNILFIKKRRDLLCNHNDGDLLTCEDNMLFSRVKIWSFRAKAHLVFHWCFYNHTVDSQNIGYFVLTMCSGLSNLFACQSFFSLTSRTPSYVSSYVSPLEFYIGSSQLSDFCPRKVLAQRPKPEEAP